MTALRGAIHSGVFSSFMFYDRRLAMPPTDVSVWRHATSFAQGRWRMGCARKRGKYELQGSLSVSQHVIDEVGNGDPVEAAKRLELLKGIPLVDGLNPVVLDLAQKLIDDFAVPATEGTDALHIATAAYHGVDVLLTWNCKHMANPYTLPKTRRIIENAGFKCPNVTTPERFMEDQEDE